MIRGWLRDPVARRLFGTPWTKGVSASTRVCLASTPIRIADAERFAQHQEQPLIDTDRPPGKIQRQRSSHVRPECALPVIVVHEVVPLEVVVTREPEVQQYHWNAGARCTPCPGDPVGQLVVARCGDRDR